MVGMMTGLPGKLGWATATLATLAGVIVTQAYTAAPRHHPGGTPHKRPSAVLGATLAELQTPEGRRLVVTSLKTGGPGISAGLHVGDRIEGVDGISTTRTSELKKMLANGHPQGIDVEIGRESGMKLLHIPPAQTELGG